VRSSVVLFCIAVLSRVQANPQVNVTQEHNNLSRDGVYVDSAFTPSAAANVTRDLSFDGTISGNVYAQPLYIEGGPNGPVVIAVTESNNVYALNAATGTVIWQRNLGPPVASGLPDGNIYSDRSTQPDSHSKSNSYHHTNADCDGDGHADARHYT